MNRYMIYYDRTAEEEDRAREIAKVLQIFPEPRHYVVDECSIFVKSPEPLGKFLQKSGFGEGGTLNGFVIQIYNINGWYKTELWDWYYSD